MLLIDKIIIGILAFFFLTGWMRGFMRSLFGPISFVFCFISAIIFYDLNRNILISAVILFAGTIALSLGFSILFTIALNTVNKEYRGKVVLFSRILGAGINIFWQGNILFITLLLLSVVPGLDGRILELQSQIPESSIMKFYKEKAVKKDTRFQAFTLSVESIRDPEKIQAIASTQEFKDFAEHSKTQTFLNDPEAVSAITEKNAIKLLQNKSLQKLVTDDGAMYLFTKISTKVYFQNLDLLSSPQTPAPPPRP